MRLRRKLALFLVLGGLLLASCRSPRATLPADDGLPTLERTTPAAPNSSEAGVSVLQTFARQYLNIRVDPLYAGDVTAQMQRILEALPPELQAAMESAPEIGAQSYWGLLRNGVAMVSTGICDEEDFCVGATEAEMKLEIQSAAFGVYTMQATKAPASETEALELVRQTFPALSGLELTPVTDASVEGYAFYLTIPERVREGGAFAVAAQSYFAGTTTAGGQPIVYAAVGTGAFSPILGLYE